tara:strand:+ start:498 stop:1187 length:690 start_codon:yes stop_codon:yes gene_type:complete
LALVWAAMSGVLVMSIKDKYIVSSIKPKETHLWLLNKHYAKRIPSISYAFGIFNGKALIGICTFGSPPSNALCVGVCGKKFKSHVMELNRLCVNDSKDKNVTSYFLSSCLKMIPKPKIIVSYADTSKNHHGYIYQATNWIYTGLSAKRTERFDKNNPNKHSKTVTQTMNYKELSIRERPQKHRYIYFLGSKKQKRIYNKSLNYQIKNYPKGKNKNYDASYSPNTQIIMF